MLIIILIFSLISAYVFYAGRMLYLSKRIKHIRYVLGFLLNKDLSKVVLIKKNNSFMTGKLNGVGGKIEKREKAPAAMAREFGEEAGLYLAPNKWTEFLFLSGKGFGINVFYSVIDDEKFNLVRTMEEEVIGIYNVADISNNNLFVMSNLKWIVPMALTIIKKEDSAKLFKVKEKW